MSLSIVILAHNEHRYLEDSIREVHCAASRVPLPVRILIIDDGSTDGTRSVGQKCAQEFENISLVVNERNMGIGESMLVGLRESAGSEYIAFIPGDHSYDCNNIAAVLKAVGSAPVICGWREGRGGRSRARSLISSLVRINLRIYAPAFNVDVGGLNVYSVTLLEKYLQPEGRYLAIFETLVAMGRDRPSNVRVAIRQIPSSAARSNSSNWRQVLELVKANVRILKRMAIV